MVLIFFFIVKCSVKVLCGKSTINFVTVLCLYGPDLTQSAENVASTLSGQSAGSGVTGAVIMFASLLVLVHVTDVFYMWLCHIALLYNASTCGESKSPLPVSQSSIGSIS